jgi:hypothetical protein
MINLTLAPPLSQNREQTILVPRARHKKAPPGLLMRRSKPPQRSCRLTERRAAHLDPQEAWQTSVATSQGARADGLLRPRGGAALLRLALTATTPVAREDLGRARTALADYTQASTQH